MNISVWFQNRAKITEAFLVGKQLGVPQVLKGFVARLLSNSTESHLIDDDYLN